MAWTNSKIMRQFVGDAFGNTAAFDMDTDVPKAALFNNTPTPNQDATGVTSGYNGAGGQWLTANEVTDVTNWTAGGRPLAGIAYHFSDTAGVVWYDATDTAGAGNVTIAGAFGTLVYDDTIAAPAGNVDQGMSYNYFGGTQSVTAGTFTIVWNVTGIWRLTLT